MYTQPHIDRISRARGVLVKIIRQLDKELNYNAGFKPSKRVLAAKDIELLVEKYSEESLLESVCDMSRSHSSSLLTVPSNPMAGTNGKSLLKWMNDRVELIKVRHYYQQFSQVAASYMDTTGASSMYGNLHSQWADRPV